MNLPRGWYVKSIRYAGKEIIDEATVFKDSAEAAIEITVSNRGAIVTGRVTDDRANPVPGATVLMFPADQERMAWKSPHTARAARAGEFRAGPVRGGDYFILALPTNARPIQPDELPRLRKLAGLAERMTIGDLDERTIDLRVVAER